MSDDEHLGREQVCLLLSAWPLPSPSPPWSVAGHPPFMVRVVGGAPPPAPAGLRLVEVTTDGDGRADNARALCDGFPLPGAGVLGDPRFRSAALRLFVGYEGDRAVAVAGSYTAHGVTEVHAVATVPDARGTARRSRGRPPWRSRRCPPRSWRATPGARPTSAWGTSR